MSSFQPSISLQQYLEDISIYHIHIQRGSKKRSESHLSWHEHGKGNKPQAAQAFDEDKKDALFLILKSAIPIQLRFKELCGGFYTKTSVSEQENISQTIRYRLLPLQFLQVQN